MSLGKSALFRHDKISKPGPSFHNCEKISRMFGTKEDQPTNKKALVRSFSDEWKIQEPDNTLSQSLAAKVEQDRKADSDKARIRKEWALLFTDTARIAEYVQIRK